ncbi:hypothetical protein D9758_013254 [Tetrapyrgos nigripes]|uniref:NAD-dependent epimerase/dehydratase domain-containing protein n=1 Tax=Tetrapyrgos nigripes TaxID=182062 RepID=A0A8H5CM91_9AGAR|nr:hypothetical protein D9758_013254 [Tetrapyrgos nigripes]
MAIVSGASGFVGSHIVYQLLQEGYSVRGAARGPKVTTLATAFESFSRFKAVEVSDISSSDLSEALKGVDGIIHTAASLPGRADSKTTIKNALDGTLHVLKSAQRAGIKKIIITSSIITFTWEGPFTDDSWNTTTLEEALANPFVSYVYAKTQADKEALKFVEAYPEIELTFFNPNWIFGPLIPAPYSHLLVPEPSPSSLSTSAYIYALLNPNNQHYTAGPGYVDVRDVARAHILALSSKHKYPQKRMMLKAPERTSYRDAISYIATRFPELKAQGRLADREKAPTEEWVDGDKWLEWSVKTKEETWPEGYKGWEECIGDTIESLLDMEKYWKSKGLELGSSRSTYLSVSGASGFVGSHVVYQLLQEGYSVRGAARGPKVTTLQTAFESFNGFKAVEVPDISSSDLSEALKGVDGIIHTAASLPGRADAKTTIKNALEGTLHVLKSAQQAGIKNIIITSSIITFAWEGPVTDDCTFFKFSPWLALCRSHVMLPPVCFGGWTAWNATTLEEALANPYVSYVYAKTQADKEALKFVEAYPEMELRLFNPNWIFGPLIPAPYSHFLVPEPSPSSLSTSAYIYALLNKNNQHYTPSPGYVDVRDVARAHILALSSKHKYPQKRMMLKAPERTSYRDAISYIAMRFPELKAQGRLADREKVPTEEWVDGDKRLDCSVKTKEETWPEGHKGWKECVGDTIESLLDMEKYWKSKGLEVGVSDAAPL